MFIYSTIAVRDRRMDFLFPSLYVENNISYIFPDSADFIYMVAD